MEPRGCNNVQPEPQPTPCGVCSYFVILEPNDKNDKTNKLRLEKKIRIKGERLRRVASLSAFEASKKLSDLFLAIFFSVFRLQKRFRVAVCEQPF